MITHSFIVRPLARSTYYFNVRIWDTRAEMEAQAIADKAMTGRALAVFNRFERCEIDNGCLGEIYLHLNPGLQKDAIHELTHAAVHYVRDIRGGDLNKTHSGEYASQWEEMLCDVMEYMLPEFRTKLVMIDRRIADAHFNSPPEPDPYPFSCHRPTRASSASPK